MNYEHVTSSPEWVLIVDDEFAIRELLTMALSALGYQCDKAEDGVDALRCLEQKEYALMISDLQMPNMTGLQLLPIAHKTYPDLAIIIATASDDRETAVTAMRAGAYDFIVKPFNLDDVQFGVNRALEKRRLALEVRAYQESLERKVAERTKELSNAHEELQRVVVSVIETIALTLEARDPYTAHHSHRVADLSVQLARELNFDEKGLEQVHLAALLHDIGKIGIKESVLHKPGKLTKEEFDHIKTHPMVGVQILRPLKHLQSIIPAVQHEHEAYDGSGYPDGIAGEDIPIEARIISVADAYDALTSDRPYRGALPHEEAIRIMHEGAGRIWDPALVKLFEQMFARELIAVA